ncbi:MAG TPA: PAS domain-containing protein, partial [Egibacteraceae bacterium]|nr:PAS domain-containing protein [Egibacteraceae bacterium]
MSQDHDFDLGIVFNHVADYLFVVRAVGERYRCLAVNDAILRLTGYRREDFVGRFVDEIEPVPASMRFARHYTEALERGSPVRFEDSLDTPAGAFVVEITVTPFEGADGGRYVLGVGRNISARRRAEQALRESNERLTETLESISDGFYVLDEHGRFTYVNESAERELGRSREELLGRSAPELYPESEHTDVYARYARAMATGQPVEFETYWPPRDTWYAIRAFSGRHGLSVYFRDVGEQRRMEEQLRQAAKMEAVGRLAGGVAHDFNNLLSSVQGHAELALARLPADGDAARHVEEVLAASERAADLVRRLMTFSRHQVLDI